MTVYTENGYANRKEYLNELRDEYGAELVNAWLLFFPQAKILMVF